MPFEVPSKRCCAKMSIGVLGFVVLSSVVASNGDDSPESNDKVQAQSQSDQTSVTQFIEHYRRVLNEADPEKIRPLYRDDDAFVWITDGVVRYPTVDSLIAAFRASMKSGMRFETTVADMKVLNHTPELASAYFSFETVGTMKGQADFKFSGAISMLLRRDAESNWQVWQGHTSTPGGPPSNQTDMPKGN